MFRLSVQPVGCVESFSAGKPATSPSSESVVEQLPLPLPPSASGRDPPTPQRCSDAEMDEEQRDVERSTKGVDCETHQMHVDDGDGAGILQHPAKANRFEGGKRATSRARLDQDMSAAVQSSSSFNCIRRSARSQHPPERLAYPVANSSDAPRPNEGRKRRAQLVTRQSRRTRSLVTRSMRRGRPLHHLLLSRALHNASTKSSGRIATAAMPAAAFSAVTAAASARGGSGDEARGSSRSTAEGAGLGERVQAGCAAVGPGHLER